jgi:hypothetical protein
MRFELFETITQQFNRAGVSEEKQSEWFEQNADFDEREPNLAACLNEIIAKLKAE